MQFPLQTRAVHFKVYILFLVSPAATATTPTAVALPKWDSFLQVLAIPWQAERNAASSDAIVRPPQQKNVLHYRPPF